MRARHADGSGGALSPLISSRCMTAAAAARRSTSPRVDRRNGAGGRMRRRRRSTAMTGCGSRIARAGRRCSSHLCRARTASRGPTMRWGALCARVAPAILGASSGFGRHGTVSGPASTAAVSWSPSETHHHGAAVPSRRSSLRRYTLWIGSASSKRANAFASAGPTRPMVSWVTDRLSRVARSGQRRR